MAADMEVALRGPQAYGLARRATTLMEEHGVWPTPLNYELWLHYAGDPDGALGKAINQLLAAGQAISEAESEALAATYLARTRLTEEIRDAGDQLTRELASVSRAMEAAQQQSAAYGQTLAGASRDLATPSEAAALKRLVDTLSDATHRAEKQNGALEKQLRDSTLEVTRLKEHLEQVRRDSMTDALTLLANRKAFDEGLAKACAEAERTGAPLTLALIDIDHFKRFNDTWGHQTGDQVLRYVAGVIGRLATPPRFAARYGGEEFAFLCPAEGAARVAQSLESMREEIGGRMLKRRSTGEELGAVTISAGYAQRRLGESLTGFIERADAALYASKRGGRNRVTAAEAVETKAAA